jgi:hypothetical protein
MVSVLGIGPKVCGFKAGQGQCIFKGDKNLFVQRGSKTVSRVARFYGMLKNLRVWFTLVLKFVLPFIACFNHLKPNGNYMCQPLTISNCEFCIVGSV